MASERRCAGVVAAPEQPSFSASQSERQAIDVVAIDFDRRISKLPSPFDAQAGPSHEEPVLVERRAVAVS